MIRESELRYEMLAMRTHSCFVFTLQEMSSSSLLIHYDSAVFAAKLLEFAFSQMAIRMKHVFIGNFFAAILANEALEFISSDGVFERMVSFFHWSLC